MLEQLKQALEATGFPFAHFGWSKAPAGDYGTYAEDSGSDFLADGGATASYYYGPLQPEARE